MKRYLFLYLAIVCFLGLLAIFVTDGYLGIYDTIKVTAGEYEQTIEPDQWYRPYYQSSVSAVWGDKVFFTYELENRRFSSYSSRIQASVWKEKEKVIDLFFGDILTGPFGKMSAEWTLDSAMLEPTELRAEQYTVKIERDGVERNLLVHFNVPYSPGAPPIKPLPAPR